MLRKKETYSGWIVWILNVSHVQIEFSLFLLFSIFASQRDEMNIFIVSAPDFD